MWDGVKAAYDKSPQLDRLRTLCELRGYEDGSLEDEAEKIGREIALDAQVLAVVGHAASATTRRAAWLYSQAGIPLIMPIATSPYAVYPPSSKAVPSNRLRNCFRLPPSDDKVQAPTLAYVAEERLKSQRAYMLGDVSEGARGYSEPLYGQLESLLGDLLIDKQQIDRKSANFQEIAGNIRAQAPDLVIFCGYGSTATLILSALRREYLDVDITKRPRILLTDGSRVKDLNTSGFDVYLTFPLPDIKYFEDCKSPDFGIVRDAVPPQGDQSFQIYGYDAMLMISKALEQCRDQEVSRDCVRRSLGRLPLFTGSTCLQYFFADGDNSLSEYYVYRSSSLKETVESSMSDKRRRSAKNANANQPKAEGSVPALALEFKVNKQDLDNFLRLKGLQR